MRLSLPMLAAVAAVGYLFARPARRRADPDLRDRLDDDAHMRAAAAAGLAAAAAVAAGAWLLSNRLRARGDAESTVEESIELDVPIGTAYNQWTQFEEFPRFMASVQAVNQVDDRHLHWRAVVGGQVKEWDAEITEQIPDQRIAWRSTGGVANSGVVTFHRISDRRTRVMLQMDYRPESMLEKAGDLVGAVKFTTRGNLKRFKTLVESRGVETGAWRGTVTQH